jgi:integrase
MSKKRGQGEGTIFEERPGRWVALVTLGYEIREDGRRIRRRKKFVAPTRKLVQEKLTGALREQQTGGVVPVQKDSLGVFLKAWIPALRSKGRSEKTIESYAFMAEQHIIPELGMVPLTKLTQVALNDYMERKLRSGLSARTVRYAHAIIRSALAKAERDGLVGRNVARLAEPPAEKKKHRVDPLKPDEAARFLATVEGHRLEALYSVALAIGLRLGEITGAEWSGLDLERGTFEVTQTCQRIKGQGMVMQRVAKTEKSMRTIPLPGFAVAALLRHRQRQAEERQFAGDRWKEHGLLFASTIGTPIEPSNLRRHFHGILKTLGIDHKRIHDLRHTAASLLLAQGATLHEVKEILGHS